LMGWACLFWARGVTTTVAWQEPDASAAHAFAGGNDQPASRAGETLISAGDLLFIQVFDVEQMTREYRVSGTGAVDIPLLPEPVKVSGLTPHQAAEAIAQKCIKAGVLTHPQISITVRESRVLSVAVAGAVKTPQLYQVFGRVSLQDILAQAGGVSDDAGSTVTITRASASRSLSAEGTGSTGGNGDPTPNAATVTVNLQKLLEGSDPSANVDVYPGDRVTVQRAGVVYVLGAVNKAGGYLLSDARQNMTVLKALALAGSLGPFAKTKKAVLLRPDPSAPGGREQIPIDLQAMLRGNVPDRPLGNNDILFVPDSTALKALHKSADVAATTAGLAVIYH